MANTQHDTKSRATQAAESRFGACAASAPVLNELSAYRQTPAVWPREKNSTGIETQDDQEEEDVALRVGMETGYSGLRILRASQCVFQKVLEYLFGAIDICDAEEMDRRFVASYQRMLLVILYPAALYSAAMIVFFFFQEKHKGIFYLISISIIKIFVFLVMARDLFVNPQTMSRLEFRCIIFFLMTYFVLLSEQLFDMESIKLILFLPLALITATVSVTVRTAIASIVICVPTILWFAYEASPSFAADYAVIALAGTLVVFCVALLTRIAIRKGISASLVADRLLREAEHNANHDMLTDLSNRREFLRQLETRLKDRRGAAPAFALAVFDLNGFKLVNDTYGHPVGDQLLVAIGARLRKLVGEADVVARLGGDEFAMIINDPGNAETLNRFGRDICAEIEQPIMIKGIPLSISASIGIVMEQADFLTVTAMLERADFALYRAKKKKRGVVVYSPKLEDERRRKLAIEHNLRHCDLAKEMYVVFQPQVDLRTGRTIGFEALARWENPDLGLVAPDVFIEAAERIGMINKLTPMFLEKALTVALEWPESLRLAFNLSVRDICSSNTIDHILQIVRESGFPHERLELEITESLFMVDFEQAQRSIRKLQAAGARVALDDFGTGYANFAYIGQLDIETIKIDRSFVSRLAAGDIAIDVIKTMIDMCASLDVASLVEGVETERQLNLLRGAGATYVQGHYYSKPMSADRIAAYLIRELQRDVSVLPAAAMEAG